VTVIGRSAWLLVACALAALAGCSAQTKPEPRTACAGCSAQSKPEPWTACAGCSAQSTPAPRTACAGCSAQSKPEPRTACAPQAPAERGKTLTFRIPAEAAVSEGQTSRTYVVHVPRSYVPSARTPLVLFFHGSGGSAAASAATSGWSELGDRDRLLAVYPQGLPFGQGGPTAWASAEPADFGIDDLCYVRAVLAAVERWFCVARGAVFATGMSSGGGMAGYLACALSGQIAAAAPIAGNHYTLMKLGCRPRRPVALLEVHGTADAVVPYQGISGSVNPLWPLPSIPTWVSKWAHLDRCRPHPSVSRPAPGQTLFRYKSCAAGGGVELYRLDGGGHAYPARLAGRPTDTVIYRYFLGHRR
jgi:polyhydroxybutyrate depolymerase